MGLEPDHRKPDVDKSKVAAIDWDNLESTYTAPGALEILREGLPSNPSKHYDMEKHNES